jgi:Uma2 family endonuclease
MSTVPSSQSSDADYVWEVATLFPHQGEWSEEGYLEITDHSNRRVEFTDGRLEFLPMPTEIHQELVAFLYRALYAFVEGLGLGKVHFSGLRLRVRPGKIREPDVIFLRKDHYHARHNRVWDGADLVMEVVSDDPKDRERDYEKKLLDYSEANVAEYWIVDFELKVVVVHRLDRGRYTVIGEFKPGQQACSVLINGFTIDVAELFAVADDITE